MILEMLSRFKRSKDGRSPVTETVASSEYSSSQLDPYFLRLLKENLPHLRGYDGREAWAREKWLEQGMTWTDNDLLRIFKENPGKYTEADLARARKDIQTLSANGYDLNKLVKSDFSSLDLAITRAQKARANRFNLDLRRIQTVRRILDSTKQLGISQLGLSSEDKNYIKQRESQLPIQLSREPATILRARKERVTKAEEEHQYDAEPLKAGRVFIISIHEEDSNSLNIVSANLPDAKKIRIDYQEGKASNSFDVIGDVMVGVHHSGAVSEKLLGEVISSGEELTLVMTGGNLRGCFSEGFSSILDSIKDIGPQKVDIHILLDHTYDNTSYDTGSFSRFPTQVLARRRSTYQVLDQGKLHDISDPGSEHKIRLYLWQTLEDMKAHALTHVQVKDQSLASL